MISLVLPCRNQADHIGDILPRYLNPLEGMGLPFELVVVPNACIDATQAVVEGLARQDPRIRVVANPGGDWGLSVRTGLDAARGTVLAYTNTARTDPQSMPDFIRLYLAGARQGRDCLVKARREARNARSANLARCCITWRPGCASASAAAMSTAHLKSSPAACIIRSQSQRPATCLIWS
jgi:glycosyltransferase involved in cell wall biosynthesis